MTQEKIPELNKGNQVIKASKGKEKGKGKVTDEDMDVEREQEDTPASEDLLAWQLFQFANASQNHAKPNANCGICFDEFRITQDPYLASISATSSANHNKGLRLPCGHQYCLGCASQYLKTELEKGPGFEWQVSCPEVSVLNGPRDSRFLPRLSMPWC